MRFQHDFHHIGVTMKVRRSRAMLGDSTLPSAGHSFWEPLALSASSLALIAGFCSSGVQIVLLRAPLSVPYSNEPSLHIFYSNFCRSALTTTDTGFPPDAGTKSKKYTLGY